MSSEERDERMNLITEAMWAFWRPYFKWMLVASTSFGLVSSASLVAAGMWANDIHAKLKLLIETRELDTGWKLGVEDRLRTGTADRFTSADYNEAASLFNMKSPPVLLPYFWEIRKSNEKR